MGSLPIFLLVNPATRQIFTHSSASLRLPACLPIVQFVLHTLKKTLFIIRKMWDLRTFLSSAPINFQKITPFVTLTLLEKIFKTFCQYKLQKYCCFSPSWRWNRKFLHFDLCQLCSLDWFAFGFMLGRECQLVGFFLSFVTTFASFLALVISFALQSCVLRPGLWNYGTGNSVQ